FFFTHVHTLSFQIPYDIVVRNTESYWRHRRSEMQIREEVERRQRQWIETLRSTRLGRLLPNIVMRPASRLAAQTETLVRMDHVDKFRFTADRLAIFPTVSLRTRTLLILVL